MGKILPKVENLLFIVYFLGLFAGVVPLVWLAPHATASEVFTMFMNNGGWNFQGSSFFVGLSRTHSLF